MVFKDRFFSSKKSDTSSPNGSNSPQSIWSNSPVRSDKKKEKSSSKEEAHTSNSPSGAAAAGVYGSPCRQTQVKDGVKKKDPKGKEAQGLGHSQLPLKPKSGQVPRPSAKKKGSDVANEASSSVSPILACSLGLNRIKTRSGPLPHESFFALMGDKGSTLGSSNLSRAGGGGGGKSRDLLKGLRESDTGNWVNNVRRVIEKRENKWSIV